MKWLDVNSVEELKTLGKFNAVKKEINQDLLDKVNITGKGWDELYSNIIQFKFLIESINKVIERENNTSIYFLSASTEYIYYLMELEGDIKIKNLGITKNHYTNKKKAKEWKDKIYKSIKEEKHPKLDEALEELNRIYELMIKRT